MKKNTLTNIIFKFENSSKKQRQSLLQLFEDELARIYGGKSRQVYLYDFKNDEINDLLGNRFGFFSFSVPNEKNKIYVCNADVKGCDLVATILGLTKVGLDFFVEDYFEHGKSLNVISDLNKEELDFQHKNKELLLSMLYDSNKLELYDKFSAEGSLCYYEAYYVLAKMLLEAVQNKEDLYELIDFYVKLINSYNTFNEEINDLRKLSENDKSLLDYENELSAENIQFLRRTYPSLYDIEEKDIVSREDSEVDSKITTLNNSYILDIFDEISPSVKSLYLLNCKGRLPNVKTNAFKSQQELLKLIVDETLKIKKLNQKKIFS